jgi:hypothetical protein
MCRWYERDEWTQRVKQTGYRRFRPERILTTPGVVVPGSLLLGFVVPGDAAAPGSGGIWACGCAVRLSAKAAMKASEMSFFTMASSKLGCLQT